MTTTPTDDEHPALTTTPTDDEHPALTTGIDDTRHPRPADIDVSGYVRRARRLADLSQRDLAAQAGVAQARIARIEQGADIGLRAFARILALAGLQLIVVDRAGRPVLPMTSDVFRDRAGRRRPAHLDVHAAPETPTMKMLLHDADPVPAGGAWHHLRAERDRLRRRSGLGAGAEQLTVGAAEQRRLKHAPRRR